MDYIHLNGPWRLYQAGEKEAIAATVPGMVHTDLLAAGKIPDPYYRDNEARVQWIGETDWTYTRHFSVDAAFLAHERVLLHCAGLDTLAEITINRQPVGKTDNMFRTWEFDIKPLLLSGDNEIVVHFTAPVPVGLKRLEEHVLPNWNGLKGGNWLRKEQCNYGWDWGPSLVTCGIWRDIRLIGFNTARLMDMHIRQDHSTPGQVTLNYQVQVERLGSAPLRAAVSVKRDGNEVSQVEVPVNSDTAAAAITIHQPELWWPNGLGEQPLYEVSISLQNASGQSLDTLHKRIGLRTLVLDRKPDEWGESFQFVVNGVPFFAKGANWIPADTFAPRVDQEWYARLLKDAAAVHMNMLRVWGGGIYEQDIFYDLCDELGLCIWQDFMFACAAYPSFDSPFMETVKVEIEENVRRLRHHPCMALWCGNNELEQGLIADEWTERTMSWQDYARLFDQLIPPIVARLDPDGSYWPCSPHSPLGNRMDFNNPKWGDAHIWDVWHGLKPFEFYRTCYHRFNSEFGFQSFPEPRTVYSYTEPHERSITSYIMEWHQRSGTGNRIIIQYLLEWFRMATSFEDTLWLSQILQGMAMRYAVEHWRRSMPRGMGTLYWQINDCWQVASWSSLDYFGRWKALHFMAREFFAPVIVSGIEDAATTSAQIYVTSDARQDQKGVIVWHLTTANGEVVEKGRISADISAQRSQMITTLNFKQAFEQHGPRDLLLWLDLQMDGCTVSRSLVLWARPKHLGLIDPAIKTQITTVNEFTYQVSLAAQHPALWAWLQLDMDARYSENFVHLRPGDPQTITVQTSQAITPAEFAQALRVCSLYDTYQ
jgi:beta-mannosidase